MSSITQKLEPDCMGELESQLLSLMITKATIQQLVEVGMPLLVSFYRRWRMRRSTLHRNDTSIDFENSTTGTDISRYFRESQMPSYHSTVEDYSEMVIQFGYLVLFGVSFPFAAVISLLNNILEVRTDAFKILKVSQRVNADKATDIGAWYHILRAMNVLAVFTNAGLLAFTAETGNSLFAGGKQLPRVSKVLMFFVLANSLLFIRKMIKYFVDDTPNSTKRRLAREKFDIARFFDRGWENAFRGSSLLNIDDQEVQECEQLVHQFDEPSDDEGGEQPLEDEQDIDEKDKAF